MKLLKYFATIASTVSLCLGEAPAANYDIPPGNYTIARANIRVVEGEHTGFYYAFQYHFAGGTIVGNDTAVMYIGLQPRTNSTNHLVFSAFGTDVVGWDPDRCGNGADFYPGVSCSTNWPWEFNVTYTTEIRLDFTNETDGSHNWVGSLIDEEAGTSVYIANFTTPESWGLIAGDPTSFDEIYDYDDPYLTPVQHCFYYTEHIVYPPVLTDSTGEVSSLLSNVTNANNTSGDNPCSPTNESGQRAYFLPNGAVRFEDGFPFNY